MKIVLKYKNSIKLYTEEITYKNLLNYIENQLQLKKDTISISYIDQDGDQIEIASDQDLAILENLFSEKSYVKVNINGEVDSLMKPKYIISQTQNSAHKQNSQIYNEREIHESTSVLVCGDIPYISTKQVKQVHNKKIKQKVRSSQEVKQFKKKKESKQKDLKNKKNKQKQVQQQKQQKNNDKNFIQFRKLMTETINIIVDERVQALIPCIRQQFHQRSPQKKQKLPKIIHEGSICKSCSCEPIAGIRYSCPKCQNFQLCQECEVYYYHQHNMLKIKKIQDKTKDQKIKKTIKKLYQNITDISQKINQQKRSGKETQNEKKICKQLKQIFGGKCQDYRQFAKDNHFINTKFLIQKYCEANHINIDQGHNKYIQMICKKLSKQYKKQSIIFKAFVSQNVNLEYKELKKLYQSMQDKQQQIISERQDKNIKVKQMERQIIKEEVLNKKIQRQAEKQKLQFKLSDKVMNKIQMNVEKFEPKKKEKKIASYGLQGQKKQIFDIMVQFYGQDRAHEYPDFIQAHLKQGRENIVQLWYNNISLLE